MSNDPDALPPNGFAGHYKRMLKRSESQDAVVEGNESNGEPDLSEPGIQNRLDETRGQLYDIINNYLGGSSDLIAIADRIVSDGDEALRIVRDEDEDEIRKKPEVLDQLEAIVRTDGSRPSFMIRNGEADRSTSPIGSWARWLDNGADMLRDAIACVGRIDIPSAIQGFQGTGFLIHENLILTNRHVLQFSADKQEDGTWKFKPDAAIDFGHEFRARSSVNRRLLRRVVFCGSKPISTSGRGGVDHEKLDLALIELEPAPATAIPRIVLSVDLAPDWAEPQQTIFTIGYPANPGFEAGYPPSLLELLFQSTYGYKRLAPGEVMRSQAAVADWTMAHDATTLGGNSGSVVLVAVRGQYAAGLHYGGKREGNGRTAENWGHVLGSTMDQTDGRTATTLKQHLEAWGVDLVDRVNSNNQ